MIPWPDMKIETHLASHFERGLTWLAYVER